MTVSVGRPRLARGERPEIYDGKVGFFRRSEVLGALEEIEHPHLDTGVAQFKGLKRPLGR